MNPQTDKVVKRTTMVATAVASYFLLTGDYGPEPNVLDPVSFPHFYLEIILSLSFCELDFVSMKIWMRTRFCYLFR
ncbi:PREDICTED: uncharacterized protein LOC109131723 [Camelina sativa]|uniref:Uncharacterized protein LOC109131723 n=1 Tax=Camelina sativa TaxID=90675 RepID=A0ABM1RHF4_CAMSA|nr:PREDICTED: uncharacterized protein LOC109131723 [Camelina sativa]